MLYMLGALQISVAPFNVDKVDESGETEYAIKPVVGAEPLLEYVGEGSNTLSLTGQLFPASLGGLSELEILRQMRVSGRPQYLMRGDGRPLGWFAILSVNARSDFLDRQGVGKQISVSISLRRDSKPGATSFFSLMSGLMQ